MSISSRVHTIQQLIETTAQETGRNPQDIQLLAVSKNQSVHAIEEAFDAGIRNFGENYLQEALNKINALDSKPIIWHFIGAIQSKKTLDIAQRFDWVHSVDREKTAFLLSKHRPENKPAINLCIQINLDNEKNKAGVCASDLYDLVKIISPLPNIKLRGLMAIPAPQQDVEAQYQSLLRLSSLLHKMNQDLQLNLDTLSMGMSDDLTAAIRAGSTIVRIGRAIFGERHAV